MEFTPDHLDALAATGIFRPSRLNDNARADLTGSDFYAIDPFYASEVDDAINTVRLRQGGYRARIAIADGSQIQAGSRDFARAMDAGDTRYWYDGRRVRVAHAMLPEPVIRELELRRPNRQRALVVSLDFDADTAPRPATLSVLPAWIKPAFITVGDFGRYFLRGLGERAGNHPIVGFHREYRNQRGLPYEDPESLGGSMEPKRFSSSVVNTFMVLANMSVAEWAKAEGLPFIYRTSSAPEFDDNDEEAAARPYHNRGYYSMEPVVHEHLATDLKGSAAEPILAHISSPLRRRVDLANHQQIGALLAGHELPLTGSHLDTITQKSNAIRRRSGRVPAEAAAPQPLNFAS